MKKYIIIPSLIGIALVSTYLYIAYFLELSLPPLPSSLVIRDSHGEEIGEVVAGQNIRHRDIVFSDIPDFYMTATIWLEDRDFWTNNGISLRGITRSILHNIEAGKIVE